MNQNQIKRKNKTKVWLLVCSFVAQILLLTATATVYASDKEKLLDQSEETSNIDNKISNPKVEDVLMMKNCISYYHEKNLRYKKKVKNINADLLSKDTTKASIGGIGGGLGLIVGGACFGGLIGGPIGAGITTAVIAPLSLTFLAIGTASVAIPSIHKTSEGKRIYQIRKAANLLMMVETGEPLYSKTQMRHIKLNAKDPVNQLDNFINTVKKDLKQSLPNSLSSKINKFFSVKKSKKDPTQSLLDNVMRGDLTQILSNQKNEELREIIVEILKVGNRIGRFCPGNDMDENNGKKWHEYFNYSDIVKIVADDIRSRYGVKKKYNLELN
ncbi:MAG: hypothetical protein HQK49_19565 [Oligoflexia bacterium]|nr:hypothetical protein [Oligoflexia bacterium]